MGRTEKQWDTLDVDALKQVAASDMSFEVAAKVLGVTKNVLITALKRRSIAWKRRYPGGRKLIDEARFRELAADPAISLRDAARVLGVSDPYPARVCKRLGIKWVSSRKKCPAGRDSRLYTALDENLLRQYAADRTMSKSRAAELMGVTATTIKRHADDLGLTWVTKHIDDGELRRTAVCILREHGFSQDSVGRLLGITSERVRQIEDAARYPLVHENAEAEQEHPDEA